MEQWTKVIEYLKKLIKVKKGGTKSRNAKTPSSVFKKSATAADSIEGKYANMSEEFSTDQYDQYKEVNRRQLYIRRPTGTVIDKIRSDK